MKDSFKSLQKQTGGSHYTDMGIQPVELTLANFGYIGLRASIYTKVNKYLARNKGSFEDHLQDLEKARHCIEFQLEAAKNEHSKQL